MHLSPRSTADGRGRGVLGCLGVGTIRIGGGGFLRGGNSSIHAGGPRGLLGTRVDRDNDTYDFTRPCGLKMAKFGFSWFKMGVLPRLIVWSGVRA